MEPTAQKKVPRLMPRALGGQHQDVRKGDSQMDIEITVGDPVLQRQFAVRNLPLLTLLPKLKDAFQVINGHLAGRADDIVGRSIFYLSCIVWEDLNEILVLSANGLLTGAMKLLRGMFERTVTLSYLALNPDQADLFWNYFKVDQHKLAARMERAFPGVFSKERLEEIHADFEEVKARYQIPHCNECARTRTNHSWSNTNIVDMAKEVGIPAHIIEGGYYIPMQETHPKVGALIDRIKKPWTTKGQRNDLSTLAVAFGLSLTTLGVLQQHFVVSQLQGFVELTTQELEAALKSVRTSVQEYETA